MPDQKKAQFKRLLEAGDGRVVNGRLVNAIWISLLAGWAGFVIKIIKGYIVDLLAPPLPTLQS